MEGDGGRGGGGEWKGTGGRVRSRERGRGRRGLPLWWGTRELGAWQLATLCPGLGSERPQEARLQALPWAAQDLGSHNEGTPLLA